MNVCPSELGSGSALRIARLTAFLSVALALVACGDDATAPHDEGVDAGNAGSDAPEPHAGNAGSQAGAASTKAGSGAAGRAGEGAGAGRSEAGSDETVDDAGIDAGMGDGGEPNQPQGMPGVRFIGRTDMDGDAVRFGWSGSGLVFRFSGTQAAVRMDDPAGFFTRLLDGEEQDELTTTPGERDYMLASGLSDGTHEIALYRKTEGFFGATRFLGVELGTGELLAPPPKAERRIEVIGDSITCGYGDEGPNESCPFEAQTENHWLTYTAIAARNLDAELTTIAWSGKGLIYNYGEDTNEPMPALYHRAIPDDANSTWDFSKWQPQVVVINLGTNDFSTDNDPSQADFVAAYKDFLAQLRDNYPDAWIMCLMPTMLSGPDLDTADAYINQVVQEVTAEGDDHVVAHALAFSQDGAGCDYHPSIATHASMATALTAELSQLLGW